MSQLKKKNKQHRKEVRAEREKMKLMKKKVPDYKYVNPLEGVKGNFTGSFGTIESSDPHKIKLNDIN
jgi:hypothetical protein